MITPVNNRSFFGFFSPKPYFAPSPKGRNAKGFTLIEVAIGSMILVFVLLSTLAALQTGFKLIEAARNTTLADQIMQSQIEDIRLHSWARLETDLPEGTTNLDLSSLPPELQAQFAGSSRVVAYAADRTDASGVKNMKKITIIVRWKSFTGRISERSFETVFTKNGINDYFISTRS